MLHSHLQSRAAEYTASTMDSQNRIGLVDPSHPELSAFGLGTAAVFMIFFGFIWLGWGFSSSPAFTDFSSDRVLPAARWICFYLAFLIFLAISIVAVVKARHRMKTLAIGPGEYRDRFSKPFRAICFFEGGGCAVAVALALGFHRVDLLAAGISLVVGVHFVPLARLFRINAYFITAAAVIAVDLVCIFVFKGKQVTFLSASATGIILWGTATYLMILERRLDREFKAS